MESLDRLLASPGPFKEVLAIIKGFRNGAVYGILNILVLSKGCKIRFPHALVMTLLFRRST